MLAAAHRLRRRSDFAAALRGGRRARRGCLVVHLRPGDPTESTRSPRVGFVVSKAVGPAVVRNTVRRRLRHLMRDHVAQVPPGALLVVRALPDAAHKPYRLLGHDLAAALAAVRSRPVEVPS